jgi:transposase
MFKYKTEDKILVYKHPVDMRKSFNGLVSLTRNVLKESPTNGALFVFIGKDRKIVKILKWDRTGFVIYAKKLEIGRFKIFVDEEKTLINKRKLFHFLDGLPIGIKR